MKIRRILAVAAALGVAAIPAAASASTAPTVYTKNYAGYYATGNFGNKVDFFSHATLPTLASLAKYTSGVTVEIRLYSTQGQLDLQLVASTRTSTAYTTKWVQSGFGSAVQAGVTYCNQHPLTVAQGATHSDEVFTQEPGYNNGDTVVDFYIDGFMVNGCEVDFRSVVHFTKVAFVASFTRTGFIKPPSPVSIVAFSGVSTIGISQFPLSHYTVGKFIATSTGTSTGAVWAKPSALNSTGDGFTVTLP
jgi:hypothetical protein